MNKKKLLFILILFALLTIVVGCNKKAYPNPSKEFYVNDYANALHPATKETIVYESDILYEETSDIETIGGVQVVFATFLVESVDDIANYNKTDIFRQWEIGKNDMGVLVIMYFTEGVEDGTTYIYLEQTEFEVGYRMESYLTAGEQGRLLDETIYSDKYEDLDMKVAYLFFEILKIAYEEVYPEYYSSFTYDMEIFEQSMNNYIEEEPNNEGLIMWFIILITGQSSIGWYFLIPTSLLLVGGVFTGRNRGGGGSSGGYGIFRR